MKSAMEPAIRYQSSRQFDPNAHNASKNIAANARGQCPLPFQYQQRPIPLQLLPQDSLYQTHPVIHPVATHAQPTTMSITSSHQSGNDSHRISPPQLKQTLFAAKSDIHPENTLIQQAVEKGSLSPASSKT